MKGLHALKFATGVLDVLLSLGFLQGGAVGSRKMCLGCHFCMMVPEQQGQQRRDDVDQLGVTEASRQERTVRRVNHADHEATRPTSRIPRRPSLNSDRAVRG